MPTASKVAFVADSTLGLSPEEALRRGIHVVPQQVIWKDKTFRDQLEITDEEVLELLRQGERLSTSQVAPEGEVTYLAHAGNPEGAKALGDILKAEGVEILGTLKAGAAVSVHAGPGTVALFAVPRG